MDPVSSIPDLESMEWETVLIYFCVVVVTALSVYLVSVHGTREKTYEEAIAEQKTRSMDLMGSKVPKKKKFSQKEHQNRKPKNKKQHNNKKEPQPVVIKNEVEAEEFEEIEPIVVETTPATSNNNNETEFIMESEEEETSVHLQEVKAEVIAVNENGEDLPEVDETQVCKTEEEPVAAATAEPTALTRTPDTVKKNKKKNKEAKKPKVVQDDLATISEKLKQLPLNTGEVEELVEMLLNKQNTEWVSTKRDYCQEVKLKEAELRQEKINNQELQARIMELRSVHEEERAKWNAMRLQFENSLDQRTKKLQATINEYTQLKNLKKQDDAAMQERMKRLLEENKRVAKARHDEEEIKKLERTKQAMETEIGLLQKQIESAFQSNKDLSNQYKEHLQRITEETQRKEGQLYRDIQRLQTEQAQCRNEYFMLQGQFQNVNERLQSVMNVRAGMKDGVVQAVDEEKEQALKSQKEKNDELRTKNSKLLEALETTEKKLTEHLKKSEELSKESAEKGRREREKEIFDELKKALNLKTCRNVKDIEESYEKLKQAQNETQEQVLHYQQVLANTENLLSSLEESLQSEERKWEAKLLEKEQQIKKLQSAAM